MYPVFAHSRRRRPTKSSRRRRIPRGAVVPRRMARGVASLPFTGRTLFGNRLPVKLNYVDRINLDPAALGLTAVHVFRANSLFDPDVTGGGHQPRGFDQVMPLYQHFVVVSARITVLGKGTDTAATIVGIALSDAATLQTANGYIEGRNRVFKGTSREGLDIKVSKTFSARKFLSKPHPLSEDRLQGSDATNPDEGAFFHVFIQGNDAAGDFTVSSWRVIIQYSAILTEPVTPAQS